MTAVWGLVLLTTIGAPSAPSGPIEPHITNGSSTDTDTVGYLGIPESGDILSGNATVDGWAWALTGVASVDVFVDGNRVGSATDRAGHVATFATKQVTFSN